MNRKWKKHLVRLAAAAVLALAICFQSFAANARIAFSDPSAEVGNEFTVTMKFTCTSGEALGNTDVMLAYDANILEFIAEGNASGGSGAIRVTSGVTDASEVATSLRFKALRAGSTQVTITSWEGYDTDGQTLTMDHQGSSSITVTAPVNYSSDASLQSLQVSPGTLEPAFSPDVENYSVTVGLDTTDLRVSAVPAHEKAQISLQGDTQLQDGENTVVCAVTAEDGTTVRNYTITVNKIEGGEGTQAASQESQAMTNLDVLATLEAARTPFKLGITALPEGVEPPAGLKESTITIGEAQVQGWAPKTDGQSPEYCVFYGVSESGNAGFYCYDMTDRTIQKYFVGAQETMDEEYLTVAERYDNLVDDYNLARGVAIGGIAAAILLLIVLLVVIFGRGKQSSNGFDEEDQPSRRKKEMRPARSLADKKLSKEEKYMLGVEDEYAEEEEESFPDDAEALESTMESEITEQPIPMKQPEFLEHSVSSIEREIEKQLADAAAAVAEEVSVEEEMEEDDFEIFDLDDVDSKSAH